MAEKKSPPAGVAHEPKLYVLCVLLNFSAQKGLKYYLSFFARNSIYIYFFQIVKKFEKKTIFKEFYTALNLERFFWEKIYEELRNCPNFENFWNRNFREYLNLQKPRFGKSLFHNFFNCVFIGNGRSQN